MEGPPLDPSRQKSCITFGTLFTQHTAQSDPTCQKLQWLTARTSTKNRVLTAPARAKGRTCLIPGATCTQRASAEGNVLILVTEPGAKAYLGQREHAERSISVGLHGRWPAGSTHELARKNGDLSRTGAEPPVPYRATQKARGVPLDPGDGKAIRETRKRRPLPSRSLRTSRPRRNARRFCAARATASPPVAFRTEGKRVGIESKEGAAIGQRIRYERGYRGTTFARR